MSIISKRRIFSLFAVAVLAGVLTFGASTVIGLDTPEVDPSDNVGVSPIFSGLTVNGDSTINGVLGTTSDITSANGDIAAPNGFIAGQSMELSGNAEIGGKLDSNDINLLGTLFNNTASNGGMVKIADALDITGTISNSNASLVLDDTVDIRNTISNSGATNMSTVKINDNLDVVNNIQTQENVVVGYVNGGKLMIKAPGYANAITLATGKITSVNGLIFDSTDGSMENTAAGGIKIKDTLDVTGEISDSNSALVLNDSVDIKNTISNSGANNGGNIQVGDGFKVTGTTTLETTDINQNLTVGGTADFGGKLYNSTNNNGGRLVLEDGNGIQVKSSVDVQSNGSASFKIDNGDASWLGIDRNEIGVYGSDLYLQNDSGYDVYVGDTDTSNLVVNGNIKADKIGNFLSVPSGVYNTINANGTLAANAFNGVQCPVGYQILSCGYNVYSSWNAGGATEYVGPGVTINGLVQKDAEDSCAVGVYNATNSVKYIKYFAMCFSPSVNN